MTGRDRRATSRRWAAGVAIAVVASGVPAAAAGAVVGQPATASTAGPARAGLATLMAAYANNLIGGSWWQAAVAQSTVETYEQATGDTTFAGDIAGTYAAYHAGRNGYPDFENAYLDDTGWWGLAWLQAYELTGDPAYLQTAEHDADDMHAYWDGTCGGGVWWTTAKGYKNAIPNELFLELAAWLHNDIPGDTSYLGWARAEWSWFATSGLINGDDLVNDGLTGGCANNGGTTWTYNQGVILAGLARLSQATGDASLVDTAQAIADAAIANLAPDGVLREPCATPGCDGDAQIFKGIFVRDLRVLATTAGTNQFDTFFQSQAGAIEATDTYAGSTFGLLWSGTTANPRTTATQASAEQALVAALGPAPARPSAVVGPDGTIRIFASAGDGSVEANSRAAGAAWSGPSSLGGDFPGNPGALVDSGGGVRVFAIGRDGRLYGDTLPAGAATWSGWVGLGRPAAALLGTPVAVQDRGGTERVYVRGGDGRLYEDRQPAGGAWSGFTGLAGTWPYDVAALVGSGGYVHLFAVGTSAALYHAQAAPGATTWSAWANLGGTVTGVPAVVQDSSGTVRVYARGTGGALTEFAAPAGSTAYTVSGRGGTWPGDPAALAGSGGYVHLFAIGGDGGGYWQDRAPGGSWSPWTGLAGALSGVPAAVQDGTGTVHLYARQAGGTLGEDQLPGGTNTWSGWAALDGG